MLKERVLRGGWYAIDPAGCGDYDLPVGLPPALALPVLRVRPAQLVGGDDVLTRLDGGRPSFREPLPVTDHARRYPARD
jgi:hypothetical protein